MSDAAVPGVVRARALRVTATVRKTLPRLDLLGLGSYDSYSVVATATDYLPEAIGAYLRLPRDWADSRTVEGGKTSLLLLIDQLDLLAVTMDAIYDAANTTDAASLISQGQGVRRLRPFWRRRLRIARPERVRLRARKPCVRARFLFLG